MPSSGSLDITMLPLGAYPEFTAEHAETAWILQACPEPAEGLTKCGKFRLPELVEGWLVHQLDDVKLAKLDEFLLGVAQSLNVDFLVVLPQCGCRHF